MIEPPPPCLRTWRPPSRASAAVARRDRAEVDGRAAAALLAHLERALTDEAHHLLDVEVQHRVEILVRVVRDVRALDERARVVDDDVDAPEGLDRAGGDLGRGVGPCD